MNVRQSGHDYCRRGGGIRAGAGRIIACRSAPLTCGDRFDAGAPAASNTRSVGRTRVFTWNPRYPFLDPLRALLASAMEYLPASEVQAYFRKRTRPRRSGKPL